MGFLELRGFIRTDENCSTLICVEMRGFAPLSEKTSRKILQT